MPVQHRAPPHQWTECCCVSVAWGKPCPAEEANCQAAQCAVPPGLFLRTLCRKEERRPPFTQPCAQSLPSQGTFPCWVHSGGSSCPRGSSPFSRHDRKDSRCPPCGKCSGGLWMPSWLTSTSVPPLSGGGECPRVRPGPVLRPPDPSPWPNR